MRPLPLDQRNQRVRRCRRRSSKSDNRFINKPPQAAAASDPANADCVGDAAQARPLVAIIIVNWNNEGLTLEALASLDKQCYPRLATFVVDNGSSTQGETLARIAAKHPQVRTIASPENLGYAGGCNLGMTVALQLGAEYVLALNNDVQLAPDAIAQLVATLSADRRAGAAGPLIYYATEPNRVWFGGGTMLMGRRVLQRHDRQGEVDTAAPTEPPRESEWLSGAAIMVRREAVEMAGLMDPAFFLYWEEVDWCYRLRRAGYRLLFVPRARAWHAVNASGTRPTALQYYWERNRLLFTQRWGTRTARLIALVKVRARLLVWRVAGIRDAAAEVQRAAYRDYLHRRFGPRAGQ